MLAGNIKEIRENKFHMTQRDFAERFTINLDTLQNWEQGRTRTPDYVITMLLTIYYALHQDVLYSDLHQG